MTYTPALVDSAAFQASFRGAIEGKTARSVTILGSRDLGWTSTSAFGDACQYLDTSQAAMNVPSPGTTLYLYSTNANDTAAGTGIQSVRTVYIDSNGDELVRTDALAGNTPVAIGSGYKAIQWMESSAVGSGGVAAGNITISSTNGAPTVATTFERITAGGGRSLSGRYVIPTGQNGYLERWTAGAIGNSMDVRLRADVFSDTRALSAGAFHFMDRAYLASGQEGVWAQDYDRYPAGATIKISALPGTAAAGNRLDCDFTLILIAV